MIIKSLLPFSVRVIDCDTVLLINALPKLSGLLFATELTATACLPIHSNGYTRGVLSTSLVLSCNVMVFRPISVGVQLSSKVWGLPVASPEGIKVNGIGFG